MVNHGIRTNINYRKGIIVAWSQANLKEGDIFTVEFYYDVDVIVKEI